MKTEIVKGSLSDLARQNNQSIAVTFISCDVIALVDCSGSMRECDAPGGRSRYDQACKELANLQESLPGKIAVISFNDMATFCPNGVPQSPMLGTSIAAALKFAKIADVPGGMRFILISDGAPDDPQAALNWAKKYKNRIDTIYVGPEGGHGLDFLQRLAAASGGSHTTSAQAKSLASSVQKLLAA